MSTVNQVMKKLKGKGNPQRRDLFKRHGARDELYGVSVADMKVIAKTIKGEQDLACELYDTGNYDAMYLAGMVADGTQMTKRQLQSWASAADWQLLSEATQGTVYSDTICHLACFAHLSSWLLVMSEPLATMPARYWASPFPVSYSLQASS